MKTNTLIGCSSFNNRFWKGVFYPENLPSKKWFEFYCKHFDTYEFNGSFYKFPTLRIFQNWYEKAPDNFIFSVKAPKEITHIRKFENCNDLITDFYEISRAGLKEKLGCILFQFPPSYAFSVEKLQNIISNLNYEFKNVIEFRHQSWWNEQVWNVFREYDITFCSVSHPGLPETILKDFPLLYIRLHGVPKMFYSSYDSDKFLTIKNETDSQNSFVYFNNTASEAGILNALQLKELSL
ncbi:DUF72 domain-containing protein [Flavobacterium foetidum]|uniref:DUF72 domain-containing protein n=1 Tax=Flavobacterium foetidum TaxID=2026681 RepID=UPI001074DFA7|nr:DUF72 domain-containing protein [Flavobacterium foetidum]KAF2518062.1 DUF72 domain-containing protein [Flavobacterium foetidum]